MSINFVFSFCLFSLPFDWKTPIGYSLAIFSFCIVTYVLTSGIVPIVCFFIGSSELFMSFNRDLTSDVKHLNKLGRKSTNDESHREIQQFFVNIVVNFSTVKQLSAFSPYFELYLLVPIDLIDFIILRFRFFAKFNDILEFAITDLFIFSLFSICCSLFALQTEIMVEY